MRFAQKSNCATSSSTAATPSIEESVHQVPPGTVITRKPNTQLLETFKIGMLGVLLLNGPLLHYKAGHPNSCCFETIMFGRVTHTRHRCKAGALSVNIHLYPFWCVSFTRVICYDQLSLLSSWRTKCVLMVASCPITVIQAMIWIADIFFCYSKRHLNNRPFDDWTNVHDLNTRQVRYSDPLCICLGGVVKPCPGNFLGSPKRRMFFCRSVAQRRSQAEQVGCPVLLPERGVHRHRHHHCHQICILRWSMCQQLKLPRISLTCSL